MNAGHPKIRSLGPQRAIVSGFIGFILCFSLSCGDAPSHLHEASTNQGASASSASLELFKTLVIAALPSKEERLLREEKCDFDSWAGPLTMQCTCRVGLKVVCEKSGRSSSTASIEISGWAEKRVFSSVCSAAYGAAREAVQLQSFEFAQSCIGDGGMAKTEGETYFW